MEQIGLAQTRVHGGNPWELMRQRGLSKDQIVDFSVDVNPFGFPTMVRSAILDHLDDVRCYPDPSAWELREAIAAHHQVPPAAILPGNGAAELIGLLARVDRVHKGLIIVPTFGEYEWVMGQIGVATTWIQTTEAAQFRLDPAHQDWSRLLEDVDLVFLCNPNNPTGVAMAKADVLEIARQCRAVGARLVVDEAFVEFVDHPHEVSVVPEVMQLDNVIVLRSLTKLFAIPGLRLGYLMAPPALVEEFRARQSAWPLNTFALAVGERVLRETAYIEHSRAAIHHLRERFTEKLRGVSSLQPFPSTTNFVLCKLLSARTAAADLCDRLERQGLLIRNCDSFDGLESGRFIRLAIRQPHEQDLVIEALSEALR